MSAELPSFPANRTTTSPYPVQQILTAKPMAVAVLSHNRRHCRISRRHCRILPIIVLSFGIYSCLAVIMKSLVTPSLHPSVVLKSVADTSPVLILFYPGHLPCKNVTAYPCHSSCPKYFVQMSAGHAFALKLMPSRIVSVITSILRQGAGNRAMRRWTLLDMNTRMNTPYQRSCRRRLVVACVMPMPALSYPLFPGKGEFTRLTCLSYSPRPLPIVSSPAHPSPQPISPACTQTTHLRYNFYAEQ